MRRDADRTAVISRKGCNSYADLNQRSLQIAALLRHQSAKPGDVIGILQERGFDFISSVVGILRSGCTYLPLDPDYPADRLAFMATDAQARLILSNHACQGKAPTFEAPLVLVDDRGCPSLAEDPGPVDVDYGDDHVVYVIYTSGTTGQPKGVPIHSRGLANFVRVQAEALRINKESRLFQNASVCFDMSVWEIFLTLATGASIAIGEKEALRDGRLFVQEMEALEVSHLLLTPSMLSIMPHRDLPALRCVVSAGEKCSQALVDRWAPGRRFFDAYGATEATIYTTLAPCFAGQTDRTVGHAMANNSIHILDTELKPLPVGEVGEIYIGGIGVASGYLHREDLTRERFVVSPFGRLYKTGDLGCLDATGALVFKGRCDNQVKVNGYRIELEEIEAAANADARVVGSHASVLTTAGEGGVENHALVLYVVHQPGVQVPARDLKAVLSRRLPAYMVPSLIVPLESFPRTGSGKIDVKALPLPATRTLGMLRSQGQPQDSIEFKLARLWERLLGHTSFGLTDSFFDVGGHSLLANQLFASIEKEFGVLAPISTIFEHETVVELAGFLRRRQSSEGFDPLVRLQVGQPDKVVYLVHPGGGTLFCYHELIRELGPQWTVFGLQSENLDFARPVQQRSIEAMALAYVGRLLDADAPKRVRLLGWSSGGLIAYEMAQLLAAKDIEVTYLGLVDSYLSGDYVRGIDLANLPHFVYRVIHGRLIDPVPPAVQESVAGLDGPDAVACIFRQAQQAGTLPPSVTLDRLQRSVEIHRENCLASLTYEPKPIAVPITLYRGTQNADAQANPLMGWEKVLPVGFRAHSLDADHYSIMTAPHIGVVAQHVR